MNQADGGNVIFRFKGDTKDLDKSISGTSSNFKGMTKSLLAATGITKAVSAGFNLITSSMDSAIDRYDTLNNFPKVMQNFGVSNEEAAKSVQRVADSILDLPTSLDQAVAGVQALFMVTKDLPKAEKMFQAINDSAMVFANGSTEAVDRFIYAYKQSMAMGKVHAQEFNQMNEAIPGVMDKVAEAMGVNFAELKEGLSEGDISIEQFNETLMKLDTEGVGSMKALRDSAFEATGGISTAITNMHSRVAAGLKSMLEAVDEGLKANGLGGIAQVFSNLGTTIKNTLISLAPTITKTITLLVDFGNWVNKNKNWLGALVVVLGSLYASFKLLTIISTITNTIKAFQLGIVTLKTTAALCGGTLSTLRAGLMMLNLTFLASPIFWIIAAIIALIAVFVLLWNKCDWFREFWGNVWEGMKAIFENVWNFIKGYIEFGINFWKVIFETAGSVVNNAITLISAYIKFGINFWKTIITAIWNFVQTVVSWISSVPSTIISFFTSLPNKMLNIGKNIMKGLWNGISGLKDWVVNKVKNMGKAILDGLKGILGIHSPSTEFALVGKYSVLGYTEALDKMKGQLQDTIDSTFGINPQLANSTSMHYSPNVVVNNEINAKTDPLGQVVTNIKTFSGGAKNDYNYGMGA